MTYTANYHKVLIASRLKLTELPLELQTTVKQFNEVLLDWKKAGNEQKKQFIEILIMSDVLLAFQLWQYAASLKNKGEQNTASKQQEEAKQEATAKLEPEKTKINVSKLEELKQKARDFKQLK